MAFDAADDLYLALREGNAIYRIDRRTTPRSITSLARANRATRATAGRPRRRRLAGPKGLAWSRGALFVADTENHVIRRIDLQPASFDTVLGTGQRGDGPEPDPPPLRARPAARRARRRVVVCST